MKVLKPTKKRTQKRLENNTGASPTTSSIEWIEGIGEAQAPREFAGTKITQIPNPNGGFVKVPEVLVEQGESMGIQ